MSDLNKLGNCLGIELNGQSFKVIEKFCMQLTKWVQLEF